VAADLATTAIPARSETVVPSTATVVQIRTTVISVPGARKSLAHAHHPNQVKHQTSNNVEEITRCRA